MITSKKLTGPLVALALLSGCAATVTGSAPDQPTASDQQVTVAPRNVDRIGYQVVGTSEMQKADDFTRIRDELDRAMRERIAASGKARANDGDRTGVRLRVTISDYRYVSAGARYAFGVMTGNAFIKGTIEAFDADTNRKLGERPFNTSSTAWQGVFSAMTPAQCDAVANSALAMIGLQPPARPTP